MMILCFTTPYKTVETQLVCSLRKTYVYFLFIAGKRNGKEKNAIHGSSTVPFNQHF